VNQCQVIDSVGFVESLTSLFNGTLYICSRKPFQREKLRKGVALISKTRCDGGQTTSLIMIMVKAFIKGTLVETVTQLGNGCTE